LTNEKINGVDIRKIKNLYSVGLPEIWKKPE
jgi:hypothetical protein